MRTQEAFTISILDCANKIGLQFSREYINSEGQKEHIFFSPLRQDKNPSLYINETKNVFYDNGGVHVGGGIVAFINYVYQNDITDTKKALAKLDTIYPELKHPSKQKGQFQSFSKPDFYTEKPPLAGRYNKKEKKSATFEVVEVKALYSYPLKNYLKDERKIDLSISNYHIKEIVYKHIEKNISFYGVGFPAGDTWAIRRKGFKGFLNKGANITTIMIDTSRKVLVFEGFMDFLTYLTREGVQQPKENVIVLNSSSFTRKAVEFIARMPVGVNKIYYYRHRDESGKESIDTMKQMTNISIVDMSESIYPTFNDLNEWHIHEHR